MTLRRKRPTTTMCCGAEVDRGVACTECGRVAGRPASAPLAVLPATALSTSVPQLVAVPKTRRAPAKPAGARRPDRPRKRLRARNPERMARRYAEDFGPLAAAVRQLQCAVAGCERASDPAHVKSRGAGGGAWIAVAGEVIGNLAPLCRGHHTGGPGIPREQTQELAGVRVFEQSVALAVKLPGQAAVAVDRLAEVARLVGEWFRQGAPGIEAAPC